jgi:hypothetical protein
MSAGLSTAAIMRAARTIFSLEETMLEPHSFAFALHTELDSDIPGLANVNNIDSIWASLPEVGFHMNLQVLGSQVALSCEKMLNILGGCVENRGKI